MITVKRTALFLAIFLAGFTVYGQQKVSFKDLPKDYRKGQRSNVREYNNIDPGEWDIIIPPDEAFPIEFFSTEPDIAESWGSKIIIPEAIRERVRAECRYGVVLKVLDTGIDEDHPDLSGSHRMPGTNYTGSPTIDDIQGHGTHVAGIATAKDFGVAAPLIDAGLLKLKSVKVLDDQGRGLFTWVANALARERAEDNRLNQQGWRVVYNASLGGGTATVGALEDELKRTIESGSMFIAATGNQGGAVSYPGNSRYTIGTGSLDRNLTVSTFSNRGPQVVGTMPGRDILSTYPDGSYATLTGTSMASPFMAGAVMVALSKWGNKIPDQRSLEVYLAKVATDLGPAGRDDLYGYGVTYIETILDTDPAPGTTPPKPDPPHQPRPDPDYPDPEPEPDKPVPDPPQPDPDPDPDQPAPDPDYPDPEPEPDKPVPPIYTVKNQFHGPYVMRWMTVSEHQRGVKFWRVVTLTDMVAKLSGPGDQQTAQQLQAALIEFFYEHGHAMVVPDGEGPADVCRYVPLFLYYFTRDKGYPVYTEQVRGYDELGGQYQIDFEKSPGMDTWYRAYSPAVKYIDTRTGKAVRY